MRCDHCQGTGWYDAIVDRKDRILARLPCPECGGYGEVSCCEGTEREIDDG